MSWIRGGFHQDIYRLPVLNENADEEEEEEEAPAFFYGTIERP